MFAPFPKPDVGERVSVSVWVEAGRSGRLLSYDASGVEPLQAGDLVRVKLRGQLHTGIVSAEAADVPEGVALSPVLERLETAAVDPLWQQMLEAVATIHDERIVHGDLKPANCFIGENDVVRLGDFNVSKVLKGGVQLMKTKIGTPRRRHTSKSLRVCASIPLPASMTMTAASTAESTR